MKRRIILAAVALLNLIIFLCPEQVRAEEATFLCTDGPRLVFKSSSSSIISIILDTENQKCAPLEAILKLKKTDNVITLLSDLQLTDEFRGRRLKFAVYSSGRGTYIWIDQPSPCNTQ